MVWLLPSVPPLQNRPYPTRKKKMYSLIKVQKHAGCVLGTYIQIHVNTNTHSLSLFLAASFLIPLHDTEQDKRQGQNHTYIDSVMFYDHKVYIQSFG